MNAEIGRLHLSITMTRPVPQASNASQEMVEDALGHAHRRDLRHRAVDADRDHWVNAATLRNGWRL